MGNDTYTEPTEKPGAAPVAAEISPNWIKLFIGESNHGPCATTIRLGIETGKGVPLNWLDNTTLDGATEFERAVRCLWSALADDESGFTLEMDKTGNAMTNEEQTTTPLVQLRRRREQLATELRDAVERFMLDTGAPVESIDFDLVPEMVVGKDRPVRMHVHDVRIRLVV